MTIADRLKLAYPKLSPGKRKIADYINANPQIVAYCTASNMAKEVGVANAQIVKFTKDLGFESYRELQEFIRDEVERRVSMPSALRNWREAELDDMEANCLRLVNQDIDNINLTFKNTGFDELEAIADLMSTAGRVGFVGSRGVAGVNMIPAVFLNQMRPDVYQIHPGINNHRDILKWWGPGDLLLGANVFSYGKGFALDLLDYGREQGCSTVWFTDMESFVQTPKKDYTHVVQWATRGAMFSFTALVTLYNNIMYLVSTKLSNSMENIAHSDQMFFGLNPPPPEHVRHFAPEKPRAPK